jgi:hypothetical protein
MPPGKNSSGITTPRTHGRPRVNGEDSTNDLGKIVQGLELYAFMADGCAEDDFAPGRQSPARLTFNADKLTILNSARFASGNRTARNPELDLLPKKEHPTHTESTHRIPAPIAALPERLRGAMEPMKNLHRILGVSSCGRRPAITSASPDSKSLPETWCISADNLLRMTAFHLCCIAGLVPSVFC